MEIFTDKCIGENCFVRRSVSYIFRRKQWEFFYVEMYYKKTNCFFEFKIAGTGFCRITTIFEKYESNKRLYILIRCETFAKKYMQMSLGIFRKESVLNVSTIIIVRVRCHESNAEYCVRVFKHVYSKYRKFLESSKYPSKLTHSY